MSTTVKFPDDGTELLRLNVGGALLVMSEYELRRLLAKDINLWTTAIKRGKAVKRAEAMGRRT